MIHYDILIPAYNAEKTLPVLLKQIQKLTYTPKNIFLVDDNSIDSTAVIAARFNCIVAVNKRNRGKGYTLRRGFEKFLNESKSGCLVCIDSDLQHPIDKIPEFLELISNKDISIVIGNRDKSIKKMPFLRILSNKITSFIISKLTGKKILDSQCGFRAIKRSVLQNITLTEDGFQMESEFILRANDLNYTMQFVNIPTIYNDQTSYIHHVRDTLKFIKLVINEWSGKNAL